MNNLIGRSASDAIRRLIQDRNLNGRPEIAELEILHGLDFQGGPCPSAAANNHPVDGPAGSGQENAIVSRKRQFGFSSPFVEISSLGVGWNTGDARECSTSRDDS